MIVEKFPTPVYLAYGTEIWQSWGLYVNEPTVKPLAPVDNTLGEQPNGKVKTRSRNVTILAGVTSVTWMGLCRF